MKTLLGVGRRDYVMCDTQMCLGCPRGGDVRSPSIPFGEFISRHPTHIKLSLPFNTAHNFTDFFVSIDLISFVDSSVVKSNISFGALASAHLALFRSLHTPTHCPTTHARTQSFGSWFLFFLRPPSNGRSPRRP